MATTKSKGFVSSSKAITKIKNQGSSFQKGIAHRSQAVLSNGKITFKLLYEPKRKSSIERWSDGSKYYKKATDGNYWILDEEYSRQQKSQNKKNKNKANRKKDILDTRMVSSGGGFGVGKKKSGSSRESVHGEAFK